MKQVTKQEFYKLLMSEKRDIILSVKGSFPFTTIFTIRSTGAIWGKEIEIDHFTSEYYLN